MKKIALVLSLTLVACLALAGCQSETGGAGDPVPGGVTEPSVSLNENKNEIEKTQPATEELEWDKIPMVMVDGKLYYDTGKESTISGRCGVMDGEITSTVDGSEIPTKDNQSNFGTGFEYQYGADNTIEIFMNEKWIVFEQREGAGNQVRYGDRMLDAEGLSEETLEWLDWYNNLPEEQQLAISAVPPDLLEENGPVKTEDAQTNDDTICSYPTVGNNLGVQLSVANVTPTGLTLICNQSGGEPTGELQTGTAYSLEKDVNGVWQAVEPMEVMGWNDEALIIEKDGKTEWNIGWSLVYGTLPAGKYRIGKDIMDFRAAGDYDISICYAEFEIAE
jgi:predicted small secreted protein